MTAFTGLRCDHFADCGEEVPEQASYVATLARARAKGWHIFTGLTYGNEPAHWILGPVCVGKRGRPPHPPEVLDGQESLF